MTTRHALWAALACLALAGAAAAQEPATEAPQPADAPADAPAPVEAPAIAPAPSEVPTVTPGLDVAATPVKADAPMPGLDTAPVPAPAEAVQPGALPPQLLTPASATPASWFDRSPWRFAIGKGDDAWALTFYGFIQADFIYDTTRSYSDFMGNSLVARDDTYAGTTGRTTFSIRNTRLGLRLEAPSFGGFKPSAVMEADFFGVEPPNANENATFSSPGFRLRRAYVSLASEWLDVLIGQTYDLFGWQNYYSPCTVEYVGLPNQLFSRNAQLRLSHLFNARGVVSVEVGAAASRPAQRDSMLPDFTGGARLLFNGFKGMTTPGNFGTVALPASIGVSGIVRQFKVDAFTPPPTQSSNSTTGWGVSIDALVPIIPAKHSGDRANRLTLTGSYVRGTGIADLITAGGGASFPTLPNPAQASPPPVYTGNVDNGLVSFDTQGVLHTIDWQAFRVGLQWYLPGSGRVIVSVNYTHGSSGNMAALFPRGGSEIELLGRVVDVSQYADANVFWDATPSLRFGLSGQFTTMHYLDGDTPHNIRAMGQAIYVF